AWWADLGHPDPYVVVEAGAGGGTLARDVLAADPDCSPALRYVLVERSQRLQEHQEAKLPMEPARQVLGPVVVDDPDEGPHALPGIGPLVTSLPDLPQRPFTGVVLANELLDNLSFRLLENTPYGWAEVRVTEQVAELLVPVTPELAHAAHRLAPDTAPGR